MSGRKVLITASEYPPGPGGIGTHAHQLAKHLFAAGYSVEVLAPQDNVTAQAATEFRDELDWTLTNPPRSGLNRALARWELTRRRLRESQPDVVIATGDRTVYTTVAQRSLPLLLTIEHGRNPLFFERRIKRWAFERADRVVAVSRYSLDALLNYARPRSSAVIPNGADEDTFRPLPSTSIQEVRSRYSIPNSNVICTVGSVTARKGQDVVIRAMPRILETIPDAVYVCAGLPIEGDTFMKLVRQLGIEQHVRFLGMVPTDVLPPLYNASDVFLMTSRHASSQFEGFGIAVIEAALCGTPAVVTAGSGLREAVENDTTGCVVPDNDHEAVATAVVRLLADPASKQRMGKAARSRALEDFTWSRVVGRYTAMIDELLRKKATP